MTVFVHTSVYFSRPEIFPAELFLYVCIDIGHHIVLVLLNASPEANRIGILKQYAFIIRIKG